MSADLLSLLLVAIGLGANNFAAAVGIASQPGAARMARVLALFTAFEVAMLALGLLAGRNAVPAVGLASRYGGGGLLVLVGILSLRHARPAAERLIFWTAFAASVDSLAVGFALGLQGSALLLALAAVAVVSGALTLLGILLGAKLGQAAPIWGRRLGALILVLVGAAVATGRI